MSATRLFENISKRSANKIAGERLVEKFLNSSDEERNDLYNKVLESGNKDLILATFEAFKARNDKIEEFADKLQESLKDLFGPMELNTALKKLDNLMLITCNSADSIPTPEEYGIDSEKFPEFLDLSKTTLAKLKDATKLELIMTEFQRACGDAMLEAALNDKPKSKCQLL